MCVESGEHEERRVRDGIAGVHHGVSVWKCVLRTKTQPAKGAEPASVFCWPLHNEYACSFVRLLEKSPQNLHDFCTVAFKSRRTPSRTIISMHLLLNSRLEKKQRL